MSKCQSFDIYESLEHCSGEIVLPGLRPRAWGVPKAQILTYPVLPAPSDESVTMADIATLKEDFVLAADAKFFSIDILDVASSIKAESQGSNYSKTFLNTLTLKYAGNDAKAAGFCRLANSDDLLFIVQMRDGSFRVMGNEKFKTETKPSQDSGMNVTDESGTQLEITVTDLGPAPFYVGKFRTAEGIMNCATGLLESESES